MNPKYTYQSLPKLLKAIPKPLVVLAIAYALIVHAALASRESDAELHLSTPSPAPNAALH